MSMPFYVSPEQLMKDRADFARKGIARGRSVAVVRYADGGRRLPDSEVATIADRVIAGRMRRPDGPAAPLEGSRA